MSRFTSSTHIHIINKHEQSHHSLIQNKKNKVENELQSWSCNANGDNFGYHFACIYLPCKLTNPQNSRKESTGERRAHVIKSIISVVTPATRCSSPHPSNVKSRAAETLISVIRHWPLAPTLISTTASHGQSGSRGRHPTSQLDVKADIIEPSRARGYSRLLSPFLLSIFRPLR